MTHFSSLFFIHVPATSEIYTLSLHDALPIFRRATMLAADLGRVAHTVLTEGAAGLTSFRVELFRPLQPMLAQGAADVKDALTRLGEGEAAFEYKLDGACIQVNKAGHEVRGFSR